MLIFGFILTLLALAFGPLLLKLMLDTVSEPVDIGNSAELQQAYGRFRRGRSWACFYAVVVATLLWAVFAAVIPWVLKFGGPGSVGSYPGQVGPNPGEVPGFISAIGGTVGGILGVLGSTMGTYFAVWRFKLNRMVEDLNSGYSSDGAAVSGG